MSNLTNDIFWEQMYERHWDEYVADCERSDTHPDYKDFMLWCEEKDLVPELWTA